MQGETVPNSGTLGSDVPDGLIVKQTFDGEVAIEAKHVGDWSRSIYNPDLGLPFDHDAEQNIIDQAKRNAKAYPSGVEWVTNSLGFVKAYAKRFSEAGIQGFHFTVIPAIRR